MILNCRKPVLILEGEGDKLAVPQLIRGLAFEHEIFDFNTAPNPILKQNIPKLRKSGQLERFIEYGLSRDDGDSLLVLLDCDDLCAKDEARAFTERARIRNPPKKTGFAFFNSEYESFFISCLDLIEAQYPECEWDLSDWNIDNDHEKIIGAKGYLTSRMKVNMSYKPTTDQSKFTSALDFDRLRDKSRSFRHLESTFLWLTGKTSDDNPVYPLLGPMSK